jgi:hypothetical protein
MRYLFLLMFCFTAFAQEDKLIVVESDNDVQGMDKYNQRVEKQMDGDVPVIIQDAQQSVKLDPAISKSGRQYYIDATKAEKLMHTPDKLISKSVPIVIGPGQDAEVIEVALWYGVTLSFKNANGELLFINRYKPGSDQIVNIDNGRPDGEGDMNADDNIVTPYLTLTNRTTVGSTNLHVWLVGARQSLSFYIKIVEKPKIYADRIDFIVVKPNGAGTEKEIVLDEYDALTMVLNNRKPDENAEPITFSDPGVSGWSLNNMMWLRTTKRLVFPTHNPKHALSSDSQNGIRVYYVNKHPIIHLVDDNGKFEKLVMEN